MTTEKKLQLTFKALERMKSNTIQSEEFKDGISFALNTLKIFFEEDLLAAGLDAKLDFLTDNKTENN